MTASVLAGGLLLAACGDDSGDETTGGGGGGGETGGTGTETEVQTIGDVDTASCDPTAAAAPVPDPEGTGEDETEITIGVFTGWDEGYVVSHLAKLALEDMGYSVTLQQQDAGVTYTGVAQGNLDVLMDGWLPNTHASYVEEFGDQLEDVGCWFDQGFLTTAVNADSPAQSLAELDQHKEAYGGRIVGIDPGAGLTKTTKEEVIPTYGLEDWDYPTSSSGAMLAELDKAMKEGNNIAVSLWHPHWAYAAYDIRDLKDPEGALGEAERLYNLGRPGFHEDFPNAAQLLKNLHLTDKQLLEIEDIMVVQNDRENKGQSVQTWLDKNPDFLEQWKAGEL
ncbi:glycine betaine ABC transporter substrate-binding protein [Haloactinopolyspora alba]|uniref:glycine betaine ABC transporter substrate-binding protein n=1 Tax=Haloactinopolyspora alba TaxID=648780 RepID=UPI00197A9781|nr:glycine betaine ABC transporter substrate-binding protein [Haloactinopolyspora alba]